MKLPSKESAKKSPKEPCLTFREICEKLGQSPGTVAGHVKKFEWFRPTIVCGNHDSGRNSYYPRSIALRFIKEYKEKFNV